MILWLIIGLAAGFFSLRHARLWWQRLISLSLLWVLLALVYIELGAH